MHIIAVLLAYLLPTNTVDGIVAFLAELGERLAAAEAAQNARAAELRDRAKMLLEAADAAEAEGSRAGRVRTKLTDLVA